jgi:hypothetical protein
MSTPKSNQDLLNQFEKNHNTKILLTPEIDSLLNYAGVIFYSEGFKDGKESVKKKIKKGAIQ